MTFIAFGLFILIAAAFISVSFLLYYHVAHYSYVGDSSKRVFIYYAGLGTLVLLCALILMIINHIVG